MILTVQMMDCVERELVARMTNSLDIGQKSTRVDADVDGHTWRHRADTVGDGSQDVDVRHAVDQFSHTTNGHASAVTDKGERIIQYS